jgi:hypothetical protein
LESRRTVSSVRIAVALASDEEEEEGESRFWFGFILSQARVDESIAESISYIPLAAQHTLTTIINSCCFFLFLSWPHPSSIKERKKNEDDRRGGTTHHNRAQR